MKRCALIPARGGSKRIPHKNIVDFVGKPMILHTIEAAKESGLFDEIVVSTEDARIKEICSAYCTVIDRPVELASDAATLRDVCLDFVEGYGKKFEVICLLEADCPLRDGEDLQKSWQDFLQGGSFMMMSVFRYGTFYPFWALANKDETGVDKEGYQFFFSEKYLTKSQQLPTVFCPSGAFKWFYRMPFLEKRTLYPKDLDVYVLEWYKALDIDTVDDLTTGKMIKMFLSENPSFFQKEKEKIGKENVVTIIPARGGSKRLVNKNKLLINNKPLFYYTVKAAQEAQLSAEIYVLSDDQEIIDQAKSYNVKTIRLSPENASDTAGVVQASLYALQNAKISCDTIIVLQPSSPLRTGEDIKKAYEQFKDAKADSLVSITEIDPHYFHWAVEKNGDHGRMHFGNDFLRQRFDLPTRYRPNGAIKMARYSYLKEKKHFFGENMAVYEMPEERSMHIATHFDYTLCKLMMER